MKRLERAADSSAGDALNRASRGRAVTASPLTARTRSEALLQLRRMFREAGVEAAALDARLLLSAALGIAAAELIARPDEPIGPAERARLDDFAQRRLAHEPVARILGEREFWGLPFLLSPETLVPRPESETLVETALALLPDRTAPLRLLDLGTGTGCLIVALLHELPGALGIAVDRAPGALQVARRNARRNGVAERAHFVACDWGAAVRGPFQLLVSNPPYISSPEIATLAPDVRAYDPALALDGGPDGLDAYRAILGRADQLIAPDGLIVLEIGHDQEAALRRLAGAFALEIVRVAYDLSGHARCVALKQAGP